MDKTSQQYTAFATASGLYEFCVLPFGLCYAPSTFQRLMHQVLHGLDRNICLIYLDDIIVFSRTFAEHLSRLRLVFDRLRAANLTLNPSKCFFGQQSVLFLGHLISRRGIQPNPEKTQVVRNFPRPRSVKDIRAFLGLASYYRRFVQNFSSIAAPLIRLTRKNIPFLWDVACETAFQRLKDALIIPPILVYPTFRNHSTFMLTPVQLVLGISLDRPSKGKTLSSRTVVANSTRLNVTIALRNGRRLRSLKVSRSTKFTSTVRNFTSIPTIMPCSG